MPVLSLTNATLGYKGTPILEHISLTLHRGEFLLLLGPNGGGKTTLLRSMVGLLPPLTGKVTCENIRRSYVPQSSTLDPIFPLSAGEVVEMGLTVANGAHAACSMVKEMLAKVGLHNADSKNFFALSGGQRQRVLIARALISKPSLLVLDEPTAAVDIASEQEIAAFLSNLVTSDELTVVLVTHHEAAFRRSNARVMKVQDGTVVQEDNFN